MKKFHKSTKIKFIIQRNPCVPSEWCFGIRGFSGCDRVFYVISLLCCDFLLYMLDFFSGGGRMFVML